MPNHSAHNKATKTKKKLSVKQMLTRAISKDKKVRQEQMDIKAGNTTINSRW